MTEFRKFTAPIPSGNSTRAAYGNVITGNRIPVTVFIPFNTIFPLTELIIERFQKADLSLRRLEVDVVQVSCPGNCDVVLSFHILSVCIRWNIL